MSTWSAGDRVVDLHPANALYPVDVLRVHDRPGRVGKEGKTSRLPDRLYDLLRRRRLDPRVGRTDIVPLHPDPQDVEHLLPSRIVVSGVPLDTGENEKRGKLPPGLKVLLFAGLPVVRQGNEVIPCLPVLENRILRGKRPVGPCGMHVEVSPVPGACGVKQ